MPLLMGAEYAVRAAAPLEDIAASDENVEFVYYDSPAALMNGAPQLRAGRTRLLAQGGGPSASFSVRSPLEFSFEPDGNGGYALSTSPRDVGAVLTGLTGACCLCALNESGFAWSCDAECRCAGSLHTLDGVATWEGYSRDWLSELRCPCATEGDDVNGAGVNMAFADAAVVFENAYTNAPGDVVARRSTTVTLGGRVVGGDFGGTLTVALSDGGRLVGTGGALPTNVAVPAGETYTFGIDYEGRTESASVGDITATATFTENMTGRILADATTLTSVRVELTPEYEINGLRNRHVAGVGEVLECRAHPQGISWNVAAVGEGKMAIIGNKTVYFCPFKAEVNGLRVNVSGVEEGYVPLFQVVEPAGVLATRAIEIDYPEAISNHAGWVGMMLDLYIVPTNVCFGAISVVEVPEYGEGIAPTGYFTDEAFSEIWHHTELTRAGEWHEVRNDNFFMQDFAECRSGLPAGWRDGQITWRIPTAWGYVEEGEEVYTSAEFGEPYFQIFTLDTSGNFRVAKLGYWTERSPDGTRRRSENMEVQP